MALILSLIKSYLILMLLLLVLSYLVPNESYRRYVQFFIGVWMCVLLLRPVFDFFRNPEETARREIGEIQDEISGRKKWEWEGPGLYELFEMDTEEKE